MVRPDASAKLKEAEKAAGGKRRKNLAILGVAATLIAGGTAVALAQTQNHEEKPQTVAASALPKIADKDGNGVSVTKAPKANAPKVDVYEDFQCPICKHMEDRLAPQMKELADSGKINLHYHMMNFLDTMLKNTSSAQGASASICAANQSRFQEFHTELFKRQPEKEGEGYTLDDFYLAGQSAGIKGAQYKTFRNCVDEMSYIDYSNTTEKKAERDGIKRTPTFKVNGQEVSAEWMNKLLNGDTTFEHVVEEYAK